MSRESVDRSQALGNPQRPNVYWWCFQHLLLQWFFTLWMGYRSRGEGHLAGLSGALVVANHQSYADPLLVGLPLPRPVSYLARDSLFRVPVIGHILRNTYVMPINREAASTASLREAIRRIEQGFLVGIFPEGTRTTSGAVGEFKPGFVSLARRAGSPIVPVGIAGAFESYPKGAWFPRFGQVRVVYGEPISAAAIAALGRDDAAIVQLIRSRVLECARQATAWRERGSGKG